VRRIEAQGEGWVGIALLAVVVAPLLEEIVFRGLLYPALRHLWAARRWGMRAAVAVTAAVFGLIHPPAVWAPMAVFGVFLAFLAESAGTVWPCVLAHAAFNGLTVAQIVFR
jgi:membrane protease YdiL (CAAX protease family)